MPPPPTPITPPITPPSASPFARLCLPPQPPRPLTAVMLDLDGTLVDTLDDFTAALNAMLADLDLPPVARAAVGLVVGKGSAHLVRTVLAQQAAQPACEAQLAHALARYQAHYATVNGQQARLYPGVVEGLDAVRAVGLPMACVTNKPQRFAEALLAQVGLAHHFERVFGGDAFERSKPDPLPLLRTCEALGSKPKRTLMVGDSRNDAQAAHAAGCPVVLLNHGYNHGEDIRRVPALAHWPSLAWLGQALSP